MIKCQPAKLTVFIDQLLYSSPSSFQAVHEKGCGTRKQSSGCTCHHDARGDDFISPRRDHVRGIDSSSRSREALVHGVSGVCPCATVAQGQTSVDGRFHRNKSIFGCKLRLFGYSVSDDKW